MPGKRKAVIIVVALLAVLWILSPFLFSDRPAADNTTVDLISIYQAAKQITETGSVRLTSQRSDYTLARGWFQYILHDEEENRSVMSVAREAVFRFHVLRPTGRWLVFEACSQGEYGGPSRQRMEVYASRGERLLATTDISGSAWMERSVFVPEEVQRAGDNELLFRFSNYYDNPNFLKGKSKGRGKTFPGVSAYFTNIGVYLGAADGPDTTKIRDENKVFQLVDHEQFLRQLPNSELSYAFKLNKGSRLSFAGVVKGHKRQKDNLKVSVKLRTDSDPQWRELWSEQFEIRGGTTSETFGTEFMLETDEDDPAEFRFCVYSQAGFSNSAVIWNRLDLELPAAEDNVNHKITRYPVRMTDRIKNVVIIINDAARADHHGCYGNEEGITPHIDQFSRSATIFKEAVATAPYTPTSVSSLFSSLLPEEHGFRRDDGVFPDDLVNMPAVFRDNGYFTLALSGSPFITVEYGLARDFHDLIYLRRREDITNNICTMDMEAVERGVRKAAESGKPVFLYVHYLPPHWPYLPPEPYRNRFIVEEDASHLLPWKIRSMLSYDMLNRASSEITNMHPRYKNNLAYADSITHELLERLKQYGLFEDSLIIITSDHGEAFGEHKDLMHRTHVYDEMIRVPLIMRVPGLNHREISEQVGLIDLLPTLIELLDLRLPEGEIEFQGRSIAYLLAGLDSPPLEYYYSRAVGPKSHFSLKGGRYKYVHEPGSEYLFDIVEDPGETENIINDHPVLAAWLRQQGMLIIASAADERGEKVELTPEQKDEMRQLGYLQ